MDKLISFICDTREQDPLLFQNYKGVRVGRDTLNAGDYTMAGYDMPGDTNSVIVERKKNCMELITNLGAKWEQFCAEAQKLYAYRHRAIVVCGPENFGYLYDRGLTKLSPNFVFKQLSYLHMEYQLPTIFCNSRDQAENYIFRFFYNIRKKDEESLNQT